MTRGRIDSGLMASELIRLAAAGRAWIAEGRIVALDRTATGDAELDAALLSLAGARLPAAAGNVGGPPPARDPGRVCRPADLSRARFAWSPAGSSGPRATQVIDASRAAAARSRLDAVVQSAATPAGHARRGHPPPGRRPTSPWWPWPAGLRDRAGRRALPRPGGPGPRARMAQIARQQVITQATAGQGTGQRPGASGRAGHGWRRRAAPGGGRRPGPGERRRGRSGAAIAAGHGRGHRGHGPRPDRGDRRRRGGQRLRRRPGTTAPRGGNGHPCRCARRPRPYRRLPAPADAGHRVSAGQP